jgi:hypothetical protein
LFCSVILESVMPVKGGYSYQFLKKIEHFCSEVAWLNHNL